MDFRPIITKYGKVKLIIAIVLVLFGVNTYFILAATLKLPPSNLGLVGYWSMDEGSGTIAHDFSGNKNNGTLSGSTLPSWVNGKVSKALNFDGSTSYVNVSMQKNSTMTFSTWATWNGSGSPMLFNAGNNGAGPDVYFACGLILWNIWDGCSNPFGSIPTNASDGKFHLYTFVIQSGNTKLYYDGALLGSATYQSPASSNTLTIGGNSSSYMWGGKLDEFRTYNRALSAAEVQQLYQAGVAKMNASQNTKVSNGLIGLWSFDAVDMNGTTAYDRSGSGNNGTLTNGANSTIGKIGQALKFNGTNSYASIPAFSSPTTVTDYSTSFWFYMKAHNSVGRTYIYDFRGDGSVVDGSAPLFLIDNSGGLGILDAFTGIELRSSAVSVLTKWHHVAVIRISGTTNIYLDGLLVQSGNAGTGGNLGVGKRLGDYSAQNTPGGNYWFNGYLDDLRVYNRALSASEIKQLYNTGAGTQVNSAQNNAPGSSLTNGLVGYWPFNGPDISGITAYDRSGQGNNGTLTGGPTKVIGKIGQALKFNGVNSGTYVNLGTSATLNPANYTVSAWVNSGSGSYYGSYGYIYSNARDCCTAGLNGIDIQFTGGTLYSTFWNNQSAGSVNSGTPVPYGSGWHHITTTYNGAVLTAYVDGVLKGSGNSSLGVGQPATFATTIGGMGYGPGTYTFDGKVDDVRLYNRALSASEVQKLYLLGK